MSDDTSTLSLTSEERALLADILDSDYRSLKQQINHAEDRNFQAELKAREAMLLGILNKVTTTD